ncbi:alkaline phosphatase family protein [Zhouia sp. PK063]|uniref:alkaline phosphatase family protein n=1 Tax=Zhouia sp. PK063 TaxID=3373602 RepID=UPI0037ADBA45
MKKIKALILILICLNTIQSIAQTKSSPKVVLITLDGYRWQELFTGADEQLISNKKYVNDTIALKQKYWRNSAEERRQILMPFLWKKAVTMGEFYGNRNKNSKVNLTNHMWFSYPGYNEILTGKADDQNITSNDKMENPNVTFLETFNNGKYKNKVAAFASWDVFPYIINEKRSGIPVNAGLDTVSGKNLTSIEKFLNAIAPEIPSPFGTSARLDFITDHYALEYMKRKHPDVVYIANDETDDFAHQGNYTKYLNAAHEADDFLKQLWNYIQNDPYYKDQTTIILTTDHGRGTIPLDNWRSHGSNIENADQTWMIIFGAKAKPLGETKNNQHYTIEIAQKMKEIL